MTLSAQTELGGFLFLSHPREWSLKKRLVSFVFRLHSHTKEALVVFPLLFSALLHLVPCTPRPFYVGSSFRPWPLLIAHNFKNLSFIYKSKGKFPGFNVALSKGSVETLGPDFCWQLKAFEVFYIDKCYTWPSRQVTYEFPLLTTHFPLIVTFKLFSCMFLYWKVMIAACNNGSIVGTSGQWKQSPKQSKSHHFEVWSLGLFSSYKINQLIFKYEHFPLNNRN